MFTTKVNVLLIDDDTIYQFVASKTLQSTGFIKNLHVCSNGKEAYHYLDQNSTNKADLPDVILLDLNMPIMSGWEFLELYQNLIKRIEKDMHLYIVTSSLNDQDKEFSKRFSCVENYVVKPLVKEKITEILTAAIPV